MTFNQFHFVQIQDNINRKILNDDQILEELENLARVLRKLYSRCPSSTVISVESSGRHLGTAGPRYFSRASVLENLANELKGAGNQRPTKKWRNWLQSIQIYYKFWTINTTKAAWENMSA